MRARMEDAGHMDKGRPSTLKPRPQKAVAHAHPGPPPKFSLLRNMAWPAEPASRRATAAAVALEPSCCRLSTDAEEFAGHQKIIVFLG